MKSLPVRITIFLLLIVFLSSGCSSVQSTLSPKGPEASQTANLSWLMFGIAAIVTIVVTGLLLLAAVRARGVDTSTVTTDNSQQDRRSITWILIGGALIPAIVLLGVMGLSVAIENTKTAEAAQSLNVDVIGHQWWWEVRYPESGVVTANEIHIPAGQPVTFRLTTADVIHSFWVPELHGKLDMIPGQTNTVVIQADRPGTYRGQCAEFCGVQHAHMAFRVVADDPADFQTWLQNQTKPAPEPAPGTKEKDGQLAFLGSACVYCHTIQGTNASGKIGPDLTHLDSRTTIGADLLANSPGNRAGWIVNSQALKPGNKMPPMYLTSDQIQSILAYLATLK